MKIPIGWNKSMLKEVVHINMGQSPPGKSVTEDSRNGMVFYQGVTDFGPKYPIPRTYTSDPKKIADKNEYCYL